MPQQLDSRPDYDRTGHSKPETYDYNAFISYSHQSDGRLAPALRQALQSFARKRQGQTALKIFLDVSNTPLTPRLWSAVETSLEKSEFLILLASEQSARSEWVLHELEYWLKNRDPSKILVVLTGGTIVRGGFSEDFDWEQTTALPDLFRGVYHEAPKFLDLRWAQTSGDTTLANPRFRDAVADIAAPLHGVSKEALFGYELDEQRRLAQVRRRIIASLGVLLVMAVVASGLALWLRDVAATERDVARQQRNMATARQMVTSAALLVRGETDLVGLQRAAALTIESWRLLETPLAAETAAQLLRSLPVARVSTGDTGRRSALSADGRRLATLPGSDQVFTFGAPLRGRIIDTATGSELAGVDLADDDISANVFPVISNGGDVAAFAAPGGTTFILTEEAEGWHTRTLSYAAESVEGAQINALAISANGRLVAVSHREGTTRVIETETGRQVAELSSVQPYSDYWLALSDDGARLFAVAMAKGRLRVRALSVATGQVDTWLPSTDEGFIRAVSISNDGRWIAITVEEEAVLLDTQPGGTLTRHRFMSSAPAIGLSNDLASVDFDDAGLQVAFGGMHGTVAVLDLETRSVTSLFEHDAQVQKLAFGPGGRTLATSTDGGSVFLHDVQTRQTLLKLPVEIRAINIALPAGSERIVLRDWDGFVQTIDSADARAIWSHRHSGGVPQTAAMSINGRFFVSAGRDGVAKVVDLLKVRELFEAHHMTPEDQPWYAQGVQHAVFSSDNQYIATAGGDQSVIVWALPSGRVVGKLDAVSKTSPQMPGVPAVALSHDGRLIAIATASTGRDTRVRVVETKTDTEVTTLGPFLSIARMRFVADDTLLAILSDQAIYLVDLAAGREVYRVVFEGDMPWLPFLEYSDAAGGQIATVGADRQRTWGAVRLLSLETREIRSLNIFSDYVSAMELSPNGLVLAAASGKGQIKLIDLATREWKTVPQHGDRVYGLAFSPDGRYLASASGDNSVRILDLRDMSIKHAYRHGQAVGTVAYSPDGSLVASGGWDGLAVVIEAESGREIARIDQGSPVLFLGFSVGGKRFVTQTRAGQAQVHSLDPERLIENLCQRVGRNLGLNEWRQLFGTDRPLRRTCPSWSD